MARILALTVWQPWASLIALEAKPFEFRGHALPSRARGARVAIHAGARPIKRGEVLDLLVRLKSKEHAWTTALRPEIAIPYLEKVLQSPGSAVLSHVLCTVRMGDRCQDGASVAPTFGGGFANDSDRLMHANRAWPLHDVKPLQPPVPAKGLQGFWWWDEESA